MIIASMNDVDKALFCALLHYHRTQRFRGVKQLDNEGVINAMVGYDDWTPNAVQIHIWTRDRKALTRRFISECFIYPFVFVGVGVAIVVTPCNNAPVLELVKRLGFTRKLTIRDGYDLGTDLAIQEMRREDCRWLARIPSGWKERSTSSA
jgi:hypothetical protein